jgi:hypothetical protein
MHVKKKFDLYQLNFITFQSFVNKSKLIFILYPVIITLEFLLFRDKVVFDR